jgi:hypothetical protein
MVCTLYQCNLIYQSTLAYLECTVRAWVIYNGKKTKTNRCTCCVSIAIKSGWNRLMVGMKWIMTSDSEPPQKSQNGAPWSVACSTTKLNGETAESKGRLRFNRTSRWQCYGSIISTKCHHWESSPISSKKQHQQCIHQISLFVTWTGSNWCHCVKTPCKHELIIIEYRHLPSLLLCWFSLFTVPLESIQTPWLFLHFGRLQPYSKINLNSCFPHQSTHNTHNDKAKQLFIWHFC